MGPARDAPARAAGLRFEIPDAVIDEVAGEIAELDRTAEPRRAFEVGRLVASRFYGGDVGEIHRRGPKDLSLVRLADRLRDRGVRGVGVLRTCLATYETLANAEDLVTSQHLTPSHVRAVCALSQPKRVSLLRLAERKAWSVRALRRASEQIAERNQGESRIAHEFIGKVRNLSDAASALVRVTANRARMAAIDPKDHERAFGELLRTMARLERGLHVATPKWVKARSASSSGR